MNVKEVIENVISHTCGDFRLDSTGDKLICGDYNTEVKGIVTTFMATVDVITQAIDLGANFIITHEPTFYTGNDELDWLYEDPLYLSKKKLIENNNIAIWRFHDYMHLGETDKIYDGLIKVLNWDDKAPDQKDKDTITNVNNNPSQLNEIMKDRLSIYEIEGESLAELASFFKDKLSMNTIQIVGDPEMKCQRVGILVGGGSLGLGREQMPMEWIREHNVDVVVCGEILEWTLCAYINDAKMLGLNKGMIVLGHERSEEWGMKYMQEWLKPLVNDCPVTFIDAKEPFIYL
ncbi:Nif3-like dinuclear metal center hexameric protein [Aquibacillus koreensis]|uniref:GTP cyclohydrolase 1 type 2 homolog n=1 Tax=Aquibacillus koreensis TaxID=279446 RepID=A0A9X4AJ87_9BACI|nr:Nif3-like dinuclear metal center hexameric protein [Aquibacillus koreensis]MCT2536720.1 Nif3-like dinuclear metal center hexameric protein [Aquibacillus koreensis]MDC3421524.1 Nif3-like dinuclear metal center hexameric protein [Aquibacillus koreensis]